jgi:hypothetical protein
MRAKHRGRALPRRLELSDNHARRATARNRIWRIWDTRWWRTATPDRRRHGTQADGYAEREAALLMLQDKQRGRRRRITVGADKAYDTKDFIAATRALNVTAHVTKNEKGRRSNLDRRTTRYPGYAMSLSRRCWTAQGRLAVRLQLRRPQPHAAAHTDNPWTTGKDRAAVRLKAAGEPETALQNASNAA